MTTEELNAALYNKMNEEQAIYIDWLLKLSPEQILRHAYEYIVRQDILFAMEYIELQPHQCEALFKSNTPIADILRDFEKIETGYMDTIRDCIENRANEVLQLEKRRGVR